MTAQTPAPSVRRPTVQIVGPTGRLVRYPLIVKPPKR